MKNEKTLQEVLKENKERTAKFLKQQMILQKKQQKKEIILTTFIILGIITITSLCLINMNRNNIQKCINAGNNKNFCEVNL